ncbi:MAG: zinc ABC transporter substrate-binding protein [Desulfobulbus sp.]|nr:zinc ABC transporter substrate-binding protein [Desulfobulbus sp.]
MRTLGIALLMLLALPAQAIEIFATVPEWAALAREIAGKEANVFVATHALQDPHRVEARPSLIARARRADLVIATGAELEIGWLPLVLRESGNPRVQPGQPGYFEAASVVRMLDVPTRLDRADGDVHAQGNPHIQTDPRNILKVAQALTERLATVDAAHAADYRAHFTAFADKWQAAEARWEKEAAPLRGVAVAVQHAAWSYLADWLGLKVVAVLEPKPGVEPSAAYLAKLVDEAKTTRPRLVIRAAYNDPRPGEWYAGQVKIPLVTLPFTVGGDDAAPDLFALFDDTVQRLLAGLK